MRNLLVTLLILLGGLLVSGLRLPRLSVKARAKSLTSKIEERSQQRKKKPETAREFVDRINGHKRENFAVRSYRSAQSVYDTIGQSGRYQRVLNLSLLCGVAGAGAGLLLGNVLLAVALAVGLYFLPLWLTQFTLYRYQQFLSNELETALSLVTTSYTRNNDILASIEENLKSIHDVTCYYYYKPVPHLVTYMITGRYMANSAFQLQSYASGATVSVIGSPLVAGYNFSGWTSGNVTTQNGAFTMPSGDVLITGSFTPRTDTLYSVQFYQQDTEGNSYTQIAADTISGKGTTDTPIKNTLDMSALALKYPGFHLSDTSQNDSTVIGGNGTSVLKLYYDRNTANVNYSFAGKPPLANPTAPAIVSHRFGSTVSIAEIPTLAGYDFSGWSSANLDISSGSFVMPDNDVIVMGTWIPHTGTPFTVESYQQNIEDDGYAKLDADTFDGQGTTDTLMPGASLRRFPKTQCSTQSGLRQKSRLRRRCPLRNKPQMPLKLPCRTPSESMAG